MHVYGLIRPRPDLVIERDWDNLIVLDACRFDAFAHLNKIPGKLSKINSPGSNTPEWMVANFGDKSMEDIIYISANPFASYIKLHQIFGTNPFYRVVEVWRYGWSEELETVHPFAINEATLINLKKYHEKRFIIHYMQPHFPFIGEYRIWRKGWGPHRTRTLLAQSPMRLEPSGYNVWAAFKNGVLGKSSVWKAYLSNLELVLAHVEKLLPHLYGVTCITSDHGNAFGRFGIFYGHRAKTPIPELIEVPWLEVGN